MYKKYHRIVLTYFYVRNHFLSGFTILESRCIYHMNRFPLAKTYEKHSRYTMIRYIRVRYANHKFGTILFGVLASNGSRVTSKL